MIEYLPRLFKALDFLSSTTTKTSHEKPYWIVVPQCTHGTVSLDFMVSFSKAQYCESKVL